MPARNLKLTDCRVSWPTGRRGRGCLTVAVSIDVGQLCRAVHAEAVHLVMKNMQYGVIFFITVLYCRALPENAVLAYVRVKSTNYIRYYF